MSNVATPFLNLSFSVKAETSPSLGHATLIVRMATLFSEPEYLLSGDVQVPISEDVLRLMKPKLYRSVRNSIDNSVAEARREYSSPLQYADGQLSPYNVGRNTLFVKVGSVRGTSYSRDGSRHWLNGQYAFEPYLQWYNPKGMNGSPHLPQIQGWILTFSELGFSDFLGFATWDKPEEIKSLIKLMMSEQESLLIMASLMHPIEMERLTKEAKIASILDRNQEAMRHSEQKMRKALRKSFFRRPSMWVSEIDLKPVLFDITSKKKISQDKINKIIALSGLNLVEAKESSFKGHHKVLSPLPLDDWNLLRSLDVDLRQRISRGDILNN